LTDPGTGVWAHDPMAGLLEPGLTGGSAVNTTSVHHHRPLLAHRLSIGALGLSGLLVLAACGADAEPAPRPVAANQAEHRANTQTRKALPWWADAARHPANQDPPTSERKPSIDAKDPQQYSPYVPPAGGTVTPAGDCLIRAIVVRC
jgi:hypothetical protein